MKFTISIFQDEDGMFIGSIPAIPSCYAQGKTQKEMLKNLTEVAKLCMRNIDDVPDSHFVGIQNIELSHA